MEKSKNAQAFMEWYNRMTPEQKKIHNQKRTEKYKEQRYKRNKQWMEENPHKVQASAHQSFVKRNYPEVFNQGDIVTADLSDYILANKGGECPYCGEQSTHLSYKTPLSQGGEHTWENIQLVSEHCYKVKQDKTEEEFIQWASKIA